MKVLDPGVIVGGEIIPFYEANFKDLATLEYSEVRIPKSSSGFRTLHIPSDDLKALQKTVLKTILYRLPVSIAAHCAVPGRSVITNAKAHMGSKSFFKVDFKDAFPSTSRQMVETALAQAFEEHLQMPDAERFAKEIAWLTTWKNGLPQGGPCSPYLLNLVCRRPLDTDLAAFAYRHDGRHTRYADDCCLSLRKGLIPEAVRGEYKHIIERFGYRLNPNKTSYNRGGSVDPVITGVTISRRGDDPFRIGLPKKEINRQRAVITHAITDDSIKEEVVFGIISWVTSVYRRIPNRLIKPFKAFLEARTPDLIPRYSRYLEYSRPDIPF